MPLRTGVDLATSNGRVDDWWKLLGDTAAVTEPLDRLVHRAHVPKCGRRNWRFKGPYRLARRRRTQQNSLASVAALKWPSFPSENGRL